MDLHSDKASQSVLTWALEVLPPSPSFFSSSFLAFNSSGLLGSLGPRQLVNSVETKVFNRSRYWLYSSTSLWPAPCKVMWSTGRKSFLLWSVANTSISTNYPRMYHQECCREYFLVVSRLVWQFKMVKTRCSNKFHGQWKGAVGRKSE